MLDICSTIDLQIEGIDNLNNIHSHIIINPFKDLAIKIYLLNDKGQRDNFMDWIKIQLSYKDFGNSIILKKIKSPDEIISIDFRNSRILGIVYSVPPARDQNGEFIIIKVKEIIYSFQKKNNSESENYFSDIYLDNYGFDLVNSLIPTDAFESNSKVWRSNITKPNILQYGELEYFIDFQEGIVKDNFGYEQNLERLPRITTRHKAMEFSSFKNHGIILTSALSFFISNSITFTRIQFRLNEEIVENHKPEPDKEKILRKDLGVYGINIDIYSFLSSLDIRLIVRTDFVIHIVHLIIQAWKFEGTNRFMFLFTVLEKLRFEILGPEAKSEYFTFTNKKEISAIIKDYLENIKVFIQEDQKELFNIGDKLVNIKYLPQKDQFTGLFAKFKIDPNDFNLDFKEVVSLRGRIFHGEYFDDDDRALMQINKNMLTFVGNIVFQYLTGKY